ncbi:chromodomain-helicase-DNA-binding protein 9-like [Asterias amurensis]|uniref:chromodomain-helicase-DNA-binding protein 9-like n=1 Tax=Asterias amurensis TaxID=7602 RepID=UPI003AB36787
MESTNNAAQGEAKTASAISPSPLKTPPRRVQVVTVGSPGTPQVQSVLTSPGGQQKATVVQVPQQQQLIRIQPQQQGRQQVLQQNLVRVSPLNTQQAVQHGSQQGQTIMVITGSPQRLQTQKPASSTSADVKSVQEHGYAISAPLSHHDYALPKSGGEKSPQVSLQSTGAGFQLIRQPVSSQATQPAAVISQQQQQPGVMQIIRTSQPQTQQIRPLTATLQGGQLVLNQQQSVQAIQSGQPVTLRLQMKDINSLQKNVSRLQQLPTKVATVSHQTSLKQQQGTVLTSQPQYIITNVNNSTQIPGIVGAQQIKIVPSVQQNQQQQQQHIVKQLPGGGMALTLLANQVVSSGAKTITIPSSLGAANTVAFTQSVLTVSSPTAAKTLMTSTTSNNTRPIAPTGLITKTITIPAGQQVIRAGVPNQSVGLSVLPQTSMGATTNKVTIPTKLQTIRAINPSQAKTIQTNLQTVRAIAPTGSTAQAVIGGTTLQSINAVLSGQSGPKTIGLSSPQQQTVCSIISAQSQTATITSTVAASTVGSGNLATLKSTVVTSTVKTVPASTQSYTVTNMGNITIQSANTATAKTEVTASAALQKAAASVAVSQNQTVTISKATTKKMPNIIRSQTPNTVVKVKQAKAKPVVQQQTIKTTTTKPIQIPGGPVGQQPGQILIMVNPRSGALEEVKKIAYEVSQLKNQPRSSENIQKLKDLQARVSQLQTSVQSVKAKNSTTGSPLTPLMLSTSSAQSSGTQKSPTSSSDTSSGEATTHSGKSSKKHKPQEKANRIVAEAVAKAKASGLQNIPKIMADVSLPEVNLEKEKKSKEKRKAKPKEPKPRKPPKEPKEKKEVKVKIAKKKSRPKKIPPKKFPASALVRLKNKRKGINDSSSSGSEAEDALLAKALPDDDFLLEKRRSSRNTKRKRYDVAYDFNISGGDSSDSDKKESDSNVDVEVDVVTVAPLAPSQTEAAKFFVENPDESEANVVEKILASHVVKKPQLPGEAQVGETEEFFVKYKNFSYLHCEWATFDKLQKGDQRIHQKIKRFRAKQRMQPAYFAELEDEPFNPDYVQVDRILDVAVTEDPDTKEVDTHYLVKWRSLPYEDSTWELEQDVDDDSIAFFKKMLDPPPHSERKRVDRAECDDWTKRDESPVYKGDNTLREYQLEGVNWLMFSWCNRQNCILADEMGLGKTIQALAFVREVQKFGIVGPFLVIAPLSTIANWQREFETWTDINAIVYHGSAQSRHMIAEYEMYYKDSKGRRIPNVYRFKVLITTYEIVLADCQELSEIEWRLSIIDEAHRLKNRNCKLLEGLRCFDVEHRVLLTGTPLQNNIDELFSLLNFLEPGRFRSISQFLGDFGDLKTESQVEKLQQLLKPMMLRRLKEDVEKNLAEKEETIIEVELTNIQKKYYRAILERNFSFLSKGTNSSANLPNLMNTMMELRKCCNHPFLINGAEEQIMVEIATQPINLELTMHMRALIQSAGKMVLLNKLLPRLKEGGHKVLIFSQMIRCLDILEDYLVQKRYPFERIDGRVRGNMRQAAIDRFSKPDSDRFVFLLCTRAGGLGINLTAADTCIIFDSDWNPQNDLQAQARCHRIGQTKSVKIYRLITRNSYEREMFDKASMKLGLDKAVLQSMRGDNQSASTTTPQQQPLSKKEIEDLLRKGAYGAIMDDDDAASKFCEEDIEMILQRRTKVMKIEGGVKGSLFAKASFALAADQRSDIKLDDPDFWDKWAKKAELDVEAMKKRESHVINEPRKRKQTRRFGNLDEMVEFTSNDEDSDDEQPAPPKKAEQKGHKASSSATATAGAPAVAIKMVKPCKSQLQSGWTRLECFRVEKGLLTYGWGRWEDVLMTTRFKRPLGEKDVEAISRTMLIFCLKFYKGDENIKSFIWDLVTPAPDGSIKDYRNHKGLSAPVPRGRKSKKPKKEEDVVPAILEYDFNARDQDPETLLTDQGYKNHLKRHCNKVLLRVRLLYYLKQEVIGDMMERIADGCEASELPLSMVLPEGEPPIGWWDEDADRSLLVGVFKHGYERYAAMRTDTTLCFLGRCGAPTKREIARENGDNDDSQLDVESMETDLKGEGADLDMKPNIRDLKDYLEEGSLSPSSIRTSSPAPMKLKSEPEPTTMPVIPGKLPFPLAPDVNTRLRRLVAAYQRNHKRQQQKQAKRARREMVKQVRFEEQLRQRQLKKQENAQKWSRREEADFYRVLATFGVEQDVMTGKYDWSNFRKVAKLERKYDHRLLEYYQHFRAMCLRKCKREEEIPQDFGSMPLPDFTIEEISEERANKVLHRIDLLLKVRNEACPHPEMEIRMRHCRKSLELPDWWEVGVHDRDLLIGVARYGINRMESQQQMLVDPDLSFKDLKEKYPLMVPVPVPLPPPVKVPSGGPGLPSSQEGDRTKSTTPRPEDDELRTSEERREDVNDRESVSSSPGKSGGNREGARDDGKQMESDESGIEDSGNEYLSQERSFKESPSMTMDDSRDVSMAQDENEFQDTGDCSTILDQKDEPDRETVQEPGCVQAVSSSVKEEPDFAEDEPDSAPSRNILDSSFEQERTSLPSSSRALDVREEEDMDCASPTHHAAGEESSQGQGSEFPDSSSVATNMTYAFLMKWPKDRVIVHRLENICHCVLKNCWPGRRQNHHAQQAALLKHPYDSDHKDYAHPGGPEALWDPNIVPPEHNYAGMADGLLALVHQRKRKRKRRVDLGGEKDPHHPSMQGKGGSLESPLDLSQGSSRYQDPDAQPEGGAEGRPGSHGRALDPNRRPSVEEMRRKKKKAYLKVKMKTMHGMGAAMRGEGEQMQTGTVKKKRKARHLNLANFKDDDHVPVINRKTDEKLSGPTAPLKKDLMMWLSANTDFIIQSHSHSALAARVNSAGNPTALEDSQENPQGNAADAKPKRRRLRNPAKLDLTKVTGEERVGIVEKESGRKLSAKLVPMLKNLADWLHKHPGYYVAPEWAEVVKIKGYLPADQYNRIMPQMAKTTSPAIQPAVYTTVLPAQSTQPFSPNHLATSADLSNKVSMQIGAGSLGGLALSGYPTLGLGTLPIGVAPIASLAGLQPATNQKGHVKEKSKKRKNIAPRKILSADQPVIAMTTPASLAGISPFLLPSTAGMYYSPFLATQGLVPTSVPMDIANVNGAGVTLNPASDPQLGPEIQVDEMEEMDAEEVEQDGEESGGDSDLE